MSKSLRIKLPRRPLTYITVIEEPDILKEGLWGKAKTGLQWPFSILFPGKIFVYDLNNEANLAHELQHAMDNTHPIGTIRKLILSFIGKYKPWAELRGEAQESKAVGFVTESSIQRIMIIHKVRRPEAIRRLHNAVIRLPNILKEIEWKS